MKELPLKRIFWTQTTLSYRTRCTGWRFWRQRGGGRGRFVWSRFFSRPPPSFFPHLPRQNPKPPTHRHLHDNRFGRAQMQRVLSIHRPFIHSHLLMSIRSSIAYTAPSLFITIVQMPSSSFFSFLPFIRSLHCIFVDSLIRWWGVHFRLLLPRLIYSKIVISPSPFLASGNGPHWLISVAWTGLIFIH